MSKRDRPQLNIRLDSHDKRASILSNLAETPFVLKSSDEQKDLFFQTVESLIQGIKFENPTKQKEVFQMNGKDALRAGRPITESIKDISEHYVYFDGQKTPYGSIFHKMLIERALVAKFMQNKQARKALIETKDFFIYHDVGEESEFTSLKEVRYIDILLRIRDCF